MYLRAHAHTHTCAYTCERAFRSVATLTAVHLPPHARRSGSSRCPPRGWRQWKRDARHLIADISPYCPRCHPHGNARRWRRYAQQINCPETKRRTRTLGNQFTSHHACAQICWPMKGRAWALSLLHTWSDANSQVRYPSPPTSLSLTRTRTHTHSFFRFDQSGDADWWRPGIRNLARNTLQDKHPVGDISAIHLRW